MKKITILAAITFFLLPVITLFAQEDMTAKPAANATTSIVITPEKFQDIAEENLGQEVEIQGLVVHVCKHGGKKMFIIGENPDIRVKITASDKVNVFKPELEGITVKVKGIVEPMAEEETIAAEEKTAEDADHTNYYHKPQFSISCQTLNTID